jgi:hypothetical protein
MTFDNVPWVATMKKNEHYFPTMEFAKEVGKDGKSKWVRRIFGEEGGQAGGLVAECMEEGAGEVNTGDDFSG